MSTIRRLPLLLLLALPGAALSQDTAPLMLSSTCLGEHRAISLPPLASGNLDLDGGVTSLGIGDMITLCIETDSVTLTTGGGPDDTMTVPCAAIRDSPDEGIGVDFTDRGSAYSLWLHIAPTGTPPVLEVGLYSGAVPNQTELLWIDTGVALCSGN